MHADWLSLQVFVRSSSTLLMIRRVPTIMTGNQPRHSLLPPNVPINRSTNEAPNNHQFVRKRKDLNCHRLVTIYCTEDQYYSVHCQGRSFDIQNHGSNTSFLVVTILWSISDNQLNDQNTITHSSLLVRSIISNTFPVVASQYPRTVSPSWTWMIVLYYQQRHLQVIWQREVYQLQGQTTTVCPFGGPYIW